jgi:mRNA interferase MazF
MSSRGSLVLVALPGDYGKPRPAVVIQSSAGSDLPSIVVCPLTTTIRPDLPAFRLTIEPSPDNGLQEPSQVMIDKPVTVPRERLRAIIGHLSEQHMASVTSALALLLDIV